MEATSTVQFAHGQAEVEAAETRLIADGYYEQDDNEGICFGGVFVGRVFAKFTPWNEAYDFVILSIFPEA